MIVTDIRKLSIPCHSVSLIEAEPIIKALEEEVSKHSNGIGLAANQVEGLGQVQVFIIKVKELIAFVNPVMVDMYDLREYYHEGCLSYPGKTIITQRFNDVWIKDDLHTSGQVFMGVEAVVIQHEYNHLLGKTMFDFEIKIPGRNERCFCGSGIKYKKCHEGVKI
jgi:peptide deformylase